MKVYLIRHGETINNEKKLVQTDDNPLNEVGDVEVEKVGLRFKDEQIDAFFTSPLDRTKNTCLGIAAYHSGVPVYDEDGLRERDHGTFAGRPMQEMFETRNREQDVLGTWKAPGGESDLEMRERVRGFYNKLAAESYDTVVCVGHVTSIVHFGLLAKDVEFNLKDYDSLMVPTTGVTLIDNFPENPTFVYVGDTSHLE